MKRSKAILRAILFGSVLGMDILAHAASSVKLSWTIPATRENGKALVASELAGYEVYYTTDNPAVTGTIKVSGGTTSTYTVQNLAAGNYHFAMAAVDTKGLKSKLSAVANIKVAASTATPGVPTGTKAIVAPSTSTLKTVNVSWIPPKIRTDKTSLAISELGGYKITLRDFFFGGDINASVSGGATTNYQMRNIASGFYVVMLTAIDTNGKQSGSSYFYLNVK